MDKIHDSTDLKPMKKVLYYTCLPFAILWIALAYGIFKLGNGLSNLGNYMSGYEFDKSCGKIYIQ